MEKKAQQNIASLIEERDHARAVYFAHHRSGNLTPAQQTGFRRRNMAYLLLLKAAETELTAELKLRALLAAEQEEHDGNA